MALYNQSGSTDFFSRLVSCFSENQTDEQLMSAVNAEFLCGFSLQKIGSCYVGLNLHIGMPDNIKKHPACLHAHVSYIDVHYC